MGVGETRHIAEAYRSGVHVGAIDGADDVVGKHGRLVFFCVPGYRELNPIKAEWAVPGVTLLDEDDFSACGIPKGSLGPVSPHAGALIVADRSLEGEVAWGIGANENDYHFFGAMPGRDFELSHVFQLGTKYSESIAATFTAEDVAAVVEAELGKRT